MCIFYRYICDLSANRKCSMHSVSHAEVSTLLLSVRKKFPSEWVIWPKEKPKQYMGFFLMLFYYPQLNYLQMLYVIYCWNMTVTWVIKVYSAQFFTQFKTVPRCLHNICRILLLKYPKVQELQKTSHILYFWFYEKQLSFRCHANQPALIPPHIVLGQWLDRLSLT